MMRKRGVLGDVPREDISRLAMIIDACFGGSLNDKSEFGMCYLESKPEAFQRATLSVGTIAPLAAEIARYLIDNGNSGAELLEKAFEKEGKKACANKLRGSRLFKARKKRDDVPSFLAQEVLDSNLQDLSKELRGDLSQLLDVTFDDLSRIFEDHSEEDIWDRMQTPDGRKFLHVLFDFSQMAFADRATLFFGSYYNPSVYFGPSSFTTAKFNPGDCVVVTAEDLRAPGNNLAQKASSHGVQLLTQTDHVPKNGQDFTNEATVVSTLDEQLSKQPELRKIFDELLDTYPSSEVPPASVVRFTKLWVEGFGPFKLGRWYHLDHVGVSLVTAETRNVFSNGFGKSTLSTTSIVWCLTGLTDDTASRKKSKPVELLNWDCQRGAIELVGLWNNVEFSVKRTLSRTETGVTPTFVFNSGGQRFDEFVDGKLSVALKLFNFPCGAQAEFRNFVMETLLWNRFSKVGFLESSEQNAMIFLGYLFDKERHSLISSRIDEVLGKASSQVESLVTKVSHEEKEEMGKEGDVRLHEQNRELCQKFNADGILNRASEVDAAKKRLDEEIKKAGDVDARLAEIEARSKLADAQLAPEESVSLNTIVSEITDLKKSKGAKEKLVTKAETLLEKKRDELKKFESMKKKKNCQICKMAIDQDAAAAARIALKEQEDNLKQELDRAEKIRDDLDSAIVEKKTQRSAFQIELQEKASNVRKLLSDERNDLTVKRDAVNSSRLIYEEKEKELLSAERGSSEKIAAIESDIAQSQMLLGQAHVATLDAKGKLAIAESEAQLWKNAKQACAPRGVLTRALCAPLLKSFEGFVNKWLQLLMWRPDPSSDDKFPKEVNKYVVSIDYNEDGCLFKQFSVDGMEVSTSCFSGSEWTRCHLSFFLAYGELWRNVTGNVKSNLFVFDECFSGVDSYGILMILQAFEKFAKTEDASVFVASISPMAHIRMNWKKIFVLCEKGHVQDM